jgi:AcrR family transcriptional regulator
MTDQPVRTGARLGATDKDAGASTQQKPAASAPLDKRARIIEAAIMVFHEQGYERARIADITDFLGIGKGTLYLYFQSKKDLLLACLGYPDEVIGDLEEELDLRGGDFFSNLRARMQRVDRYNWFSPLLDLTRASEHSPDPEVSSKAKESSRFGVTRLERDLVKAIQDGKSRDVDAELAVWAYVGMVENIRRRVLADDRYSVAEGEDFVIEAMSAWLSPNPERAVLDTAAWRGPLTVGTQDGNRMELREVRFGGKACLGCWLGLVETYVEPDRLRSVAIRRSDDALTGTLQTRDGDQFEVRLDPGMVVSGESVLGISRVELLDVASLTFV